MRNYLWVPIFSMISGLATSAMGVSPITTLAAVFGGLALFGFMLWLERHGKDELSRLEHELWQMRKDQETAHGELSARLNSLSNRVTGFGE